MALRTPRPSLTGDDPMSALASLLGVAPDDATAAYVAPGVGAIPNIPPPTTQGEAESPYERASSARATAADTADRAHAAAAQKSLEDMFLPGGAQDLAEKASQRKQAEEAVAPMIQGQTQLAIENAKAEAEKYKADAAVRAAGLKTDSKGNGFVIGPDGRPINTKPLGQLEQRAITSFAEAKPVLDSLEKTLDPSGNQFASWMKNVGNAGMYKMGISAGTPADQAKAQLSGLLGIIGSSPYVVGSRSFQMIKLAMQHLTSPYQSDAFMQNQINEIRRLWPEMQREILEAHIDPGSPALTASPSPDAAAGYLSTDENAFK